MYVKIIKCSNRNYWYQDKVGFIFNVIDQGEKGYYFDYGRPVEEKDCEVIDFSENQITEEFADRLLLPFSLSLSGLDIKFKDEKDYWKRLETVRKRIKDFWINNKYVKKQSREEVIKEQLKTMKDLDGVDFHYDSEYHIDLLKELVEILENKLKGDK